MEDDICNLCGQPIEPGDLTLQDGDGAPAHEDCVMEDGDDW